MSDHTPNDNAPKPCPKCGHKTPAVAPTLLYNGIYVVCHQCKATDHRRRYPEAGDRALEQGHIGGIATQISRRTGSLGPTPNCLLVYPHGPVLDPAPARCPRTHWLAAGMSRTGVVTISSVNTNLIRAPMCLRQASSAISPRQLVLAEQQIQ